MVFPSALILARLDVDTIHTFLSNDSYWALGRPREVTKCAIANSIPFGVYAETNDAQIGFARVVTDRATFAYLCDVFILPLHRGQGLSPSGVKLRTSFLGRETASGAAGRTVPGMVRSIKELEHLNYVFLIMLVLEYKLVVSNPQVTQITEAMRCVQFIRNKALRLWNDTNAKPYDLNRYCAVLAKQYPFAGKLNSQARQAASERAAYAISRFLKADKTGKRLKRPRYQKDNRSVEYKTTGWKLSQDRKRITFTDGIGIGKIKMLGTRDLCPYDLATIKRVRIVRRADLFFVQFCLEVDRREPSEPTGTTLGLDLGLSSFYTDSNGDKVACPRFLRKAEKRLQREQRRLSGKQKGSRNRAKAKVKVARRHLQITNQRKDFAVKLARCVVKSSDLVALEDLQVANLVRNSRLSKSISDAAWSQFSQWLVYFGQVFGKPVVKVAPHYTSQDCSGCGKRVKKSLSERTHACSCGLLLDRDENAARNILRLGLEQ